MKISHAMVIMFIGSCIVQYYLMPSIMVSNKMDITNNVGKGYMAVIMGLFMVLIEIMMHDHQYKVLSTHLYVLLMSCLILFIYLYRTQTAINDKQYLEGMIEHHSMGIFTSEAILKKTDNYDIAKLSKNIIQIQADEISVMRELIHKM